MPDPDRDSDRDRAHDRDTEPDPDHRPNQENERTCDPACNPDRDTDRASVTTHPKSAGFMRSSVSKRVPLQSARCPIAIRISSRAELARRTSIPTSPSSTFETTR